MRFRKRPVFVDAVQLTQAMIDAHVLDKVPLPAGCRVTYANFHEARRQVYRVTVRAMTRDRDLVSPGDWIVTDFYGQVSVCAPDLFAEMYEPAEATKP